jgi:hypothetical protein
VAAEASVAANVGTVAELGITHERAKKIQRYLLNLMRARHV